MSYLQDLFYRLVCRNASEWYIASLRCEGAERNDLMAESYRWFDIASSIEAMDDNTYCEFVKAYAAEYIATYLELSAAYPEVLQ